MFVNRGSHKDRLEVKRLGSSNVDVQVTLEQDASPPLYKLHSGLAEVGCLLSVADAEACCDQPSRMRADVA